MDISFADTFEKSLKRLVWHESKLYKFYSLFRYDIPRFLKNIWRFRKALWNHYWFDHHGMLMFMKTAALHMANEVEKYGMEIDESRLKKVAQMRRFAEIINNYNESNWIELAEAELGEIVFRGFEFEAVPDKPGFSRLVDNETEDEKKHNSKVYSRANEIEEQQWSELCQIIKGQDTTLFDKDKDFYKQFDGTGLRSWWD